MKNEVLDLLSEVDFPKEIPGINEDTLVFSKTPNREAVEKTIAENRCKAIKLVESLQKLCIRNNITIEEDYIRRKADLDADSISTLIKQIDGTCKASQLLIDAIEIGECDPKLFASLAQLNKSIVELLKYQNEFIQSIKVEYSTIDEESVDTEVVIDESGMEDAAEVKELPQQTTTFVGTKDIMARLQEQLKMINNEDQSE